MTVVANDGKSAVSTSGKTSGKPEVGTSGKSDLPLEPDILPLMAGDDDDIELGADVGATAKGWRLEQNSDGYWRWRWQLKDENGKPVTYVNKSGKTVYQRGFKYVPIKELEKAKREAGL